MPQYIVYEQPLSERIRQFLRTEQLFQQTRYRLEQIFSVWDVKECVTMIVTLIQFIERSDLKGELFKELERQMNTFQRIGKAAQVPKAPLNEILSELDKALTEIKLLNKAMLPTKDSLLLQNIQQRLSLQGGICAFDIPALHYWVNQPIELCRPQMQNWLNALKPLENILHFILRLIRTSQDFKSEMAEGGLFQQSLDPQFACQLIRIQLPQGFGYYPEISASKYRVHVRFLNGNVDSRKSQPEEAVPFQWACCAI